MYDFLKGSVVAIDASGALSLEVNGVGYLLKVSEQTRQALPLDGSVVTVYVRLLVKEDDLTLIGFADVAERAAFDLLRTVQGVGPSVALAICSGYPTDEMRQLLVRKDATALKKVKGVGAKSADRLVLELHDKVDRIPAAFITGDGAETPQPVEDEVRRALIALGFSAKEGADALATVAGQSNDPEELLRLCLGALRK